MADAKHSGWLGERIYLAVTAALGCFLGIGVAEPADADALKSAYGEFAQAARALNPDYQPQTVNTDGWSAAQQA